MVGWRTAEEATPPPRRVRRIRDDVRDGALVAAVTALASVCLVVVLTLLMKLAG